MNLKLLWATGSLLLLNVVAASFPNIRIRPFKHSSSEVETYLYQFHNTTFNNPHPGITEELLQKGSHKFNVNRRRQRIGTGKNCYKKARNCIRNGDIINKCLPWARILTAEKEIDLNSGSLLATHVLCYKLIWALNPCKVVFAHWNKPLSKARFLQDCSSKGLYSTIAFSTLKGHLLEGEERFTVEWHPKDDSVWLDLYSVSCGSGLLGKLCIPLIRPIQKSFFREISTQMVQVVKTDS